MIKWKRKLNTVKEREKKIRGRGRKIFYDMQFLQSNCETKLCSKPVLVVCSLILGYRSFHAF